MLERVSVPVCCWAPLVHVPHRASRREYVISDTLQIAGSCDES